MFSMFQNKNLSLKTTIIRLNRADWFYFIIR